ncbi:hypothetical protein ADK38_41115 [Streptomyces varsoviensis]|uniref:Uncharacterized protein n=1 Tax=Streptomyces varsoviensis TaxID=67373 RepID=A0ABR5IU19_9ACTN|nr:hypothetical protein ADK38_41115 [Streptomyces varsoviensis]
MSDQHGFYLAEFDTEAAQLDLIVRAPHVLDVTVRATPHHIPRAIHPPTGRPVRIGDEPLGRQPRPAVIATGQDHTRYVQLTGNTHRHRLQ